MEPILPVLKHLNALDYVVVGIYLLIVAGVGIYMSRFNKNTGDYFKAGGRLPWLMSSISLFVSGFSAFMFVSASGFVYRNGLIAVVVFTSSFAAYWLGFYVYGKLWKRARLDSPMEFLTRRFSRSTTYVYTIITILPNILLMGALFYTLSIFISSALGIGGMEFDLGMMTLSGFQLTLICIGVVLLIYTVLGGLWAVAVTDTIQFVILLLMTLVVFPLSFMHLGEGSFAVGVSTLVEQAPENYLSLDFAKVGVVFVISLWVMNLVGYNANWHVGQRYYSVADERDTKKIARLAAILGLVLPLLWILPVLSAKVIFPDMGALWPELKEPTEASFVSLCLLFIPHGFLGVVVSAMLAASMSSADSTFNWLAAVFTKEVYVPVAEKTGKKVKPSEKQQLLVGKMTILIVGILSILVAMGMQDYSSSFDIYLKIYSVTLPAMFMPVMIGFVYHKTPWWSAIAAALGTIAITVAANIAVNLIGDASIGSFGDIFAEVKLNLGGLEIGKYSLNVMVGIIVSPGIFLFSSFWKNTEAKDIERLEKFVEDLETPVYDEESGYDQKSLHAYRLVGVLSAMIGFLLILLSFFVGGKGGFGINFAAGIAAIGFGVLFWWLAGKYMDKNAGKSTAAHEENEHIR